MTKFPKSLFVRVGGEGNDEYWWAAEDAVELADESHGTLDVAVYQLVSTGKLATRTQFIEDAKRASKKSK